MNYGDLNSGNTQALFNALSKLNIPVPEIGDPVKARDIIKTRSESIFRDWRRLNDILDRHEKTILKRWKKKTTKGRTEVLLQAWPEMAKLHRPDFEAIRRESPEQREKATKFRSWFLWPYINVEDLVQEDMLPLLIRSRASNSLSVFANADKEAFDLGRLTRAVSLLYIEKHTMIFTNRQGPEDYGELLFWDNKEAAHKSPEHEMSMDVGSGLLVLEIQEELFRFLNRCCEIVLHDYRSDKLTSDQFPVLPRVEISDPNLNKIASLSEMAAESPYRAPNKMDLSRLRSVVAAKVEAAKDHIWSMREDPGYYTDNLLEFREHSSEMIKDYAGREHSLLQPQHKAALWQKVIAKSITTSQTHLELWTDLLQQVRKLQDWQAKQVDQSFFGDNLAPGHLQALAAFRYTVCRHFEFLTTLFKESAPASPELRTYFYLQSHANLRGLEPRIETKQRLNLDRVQNELLWLVNVLSREHDQLRVVGIVKVIDEMGRLVEREPTAQELISSFVAALIGDIAIIAEALRQIDVFQPWAQTVKKSTNDHNAELKQEYEDRTDYWFRLMRPIGGPNRVEIAKMGTPEEGRFLYPVHKRATKENVIAMRAAERNLDAFWNAVDANMKKQGVEQLEHSALYQLLSQPRALRRTAAIMDVEVKQQIPEPVKTIQQPLSQLSLGIDEETGQTTGRKVFDSYSANMPKPKRRDAQTESNADEEDNQQEHPAMDEEQNLQPTIAVDKQTLKVFESLFHVPSASATPGEVPWSDFQRAMVFIGFSAEKLYGSVWQFKPVGLNVERSIQFHEPHPARKIPYRVARRFGRRLERAYGWSRATFVEDT